MLPGKTYTPDEVLRLLLKHRWLVVLPFVVGLTLAVVAASRISERYRSETLIMVMPQRISTDILPQMLNERIEDRLPSISDQILSRSRLERIISEFDLYPEARARGAIMEDVVQRMRERDIKVSDRRAWKGVVQGRVRERQCGDGAQGHRAAGVPVHRGEPQGQGHPGAEHECFSRYRAGDGKGQAARGREASGAVSKQYAGQLPSQADSNQQAIQGAQLQLQAVSATINRARERRLLAQQQLADAQTQPQPSPSWKTPLGRLLA